MIILGHFHFSLGVVGHKLLRSLVLSLSTLYLLPVLIGCPFQCIVMIGDATPHAPHSSDNQSGIDWRTEAALLKEANIKCYAVKCLAWPESTSFYRQLANLTGGFYLELAQFNAITDFMIAISMNESAPENLENFSQEIQQRDGNLTRNMRHLFATLTGNAAEVDPTPEDLSAVAAVRYVSCAMEERHKRRVNLVTNTPFYDS